MQDKNDQPVRHDWLGSILIWIAETTRASRLARLSTIGLRIPRYREPSSERRRERDWMEEN